MSVVKTADENMELTASWKKNNRGLYEYVLHLHAFHFSFFCAVDVVANISVTEQV
jgi:hypothetical protein